jgi:hypothetical protein
MIEIKRLRLNSTQLLNRILRRRVTPVLLSVELICTAIHATTFSTCYKVHPRRCSTRT